MLLQQSLDADVRLSPVDEVETVHRQRSAIRPLETLPYILD